MNSIEFTDRECQKLLNEVGLPICSGGAELFCTAFNEAANALIKELEIAPFPSRSKVRTQIEALDRPLRKFLDFYGIQVDFYTGQEHKNAYALWPQILNEFAQHPEHKPPAELKAHINNVTKEARKLYQAMCAAISYLNDHAGLPGGEGPYARKAAARRFVEKLLDAAPHIFDAPLSINTDTAITKRTAAGQNRRLTGSAITYLGQSLTMVRQKLSSTGLSMRAADVGLRIPDTTISNWFYEIKNKII